VDWDVVGSVITAVVFILTVGGVLILRPITKRLSEILELYARDRHSGLHSDVGQMRDMLETMSARLQLLEDRQDFTERLLGSGEKGGKAPPPGAEGPLRR
jgi:hypothetical protein